MNLKSIRKAANKSQIEVAEKCGLTLRSYQNYESQAREMSYKTLSTIADYFGCSIDFLLGHQTPGLISLEGASEEQQKIIKLVLTMNDKQASFSLGYLTDYMGLPASYARPTRPF